VAQTAEFERRSQDTRDHEYATLLRSEMEALSHDTNPFASGQIYPPHSPNYQGFNLSLFFLGWIILLGCPVIPASFIICLLTLLLMPLAGLHFYID
jgi:hypothetical protein